MNDLKKCPVCAEEIQTAALKCPHCGTVLVSPEWQQVVYQWRTLPEPERARYWASLSREQQTKFQAINAILADNRGMVQNNEFGKGKVVSNNKFGCGFILLLVIGIIIAGAVMSHKALPPRDPSILNTVFHLVGYFKTDGMRGFTYFVKNPNEQDIEAFCRKEKATFSSGRILKIHFFDDRANTPDVTLRYYFPESSDAYLVADYFFNPFNGKQGLKIHKDIPEQPKKRGQ